MKIVPRDFSQILGLSAWSRMSFWLKSSPSITDQSMKVSSVSYLREQFPTREIIWAKSGQSWPKSAMRVMQKVARANMLGGWFFQHFIGIKFSWGSAKKSLRMVIGYPLRSPIKVHSVDAHCKKHRVKKQC